MSSPSFTQSVEQKCKTTPKKKQLCKILGRGNHMHASPSQEFTWPFFSCDFVSLHKQWTKQKWAQNNEVQV